MKNMLIVFEGIDGVGKTTLSKLLTDELIKRGIRTIRYEDIEEKEGGFNLVKLFVKKQAPVNSSLFFYIASAIHKSQQIEKLLNNSWVVCDRYIYSTLAYHKIRKADLSLISNIKNLPIRIPDFSFLVKIKERVRLQRIKSRLDNNVYDLKLKTDRNFVGKMEKELEKFELKIIDNSRSNPERVIKEIFKIVSGQ